MHNGVPGALAKCLAVNLCELMRDKGSIYVHLDPGVSHYIKAILDQVFGSENFRNEIIWKRTSAHSSAKRYGPVHDVILFYSRSEAYTWRHAYGSYDVDYVAVFFDQTDPDGRRWKRTDLTGSGVRHGDTGQPWRGIDVTAKGRHWAQPPAVLDQLEAQGRIHWPHKEGGMPRLKQYPEDLAGMPLQDVWTDIRPMHNLSRERLGYPTQKPEPLLERIVRASSDEGDLVLDCVCGSGTTAVVAEKLNRRWIAADVGRFAIHTSRKRLLSATGVRPFTVQNLGKYERQAWQAAEFGDQAELAYRRFMLTLYRAQPLSGYAWLHGLKNGHLVYVGSVDAPVSTGDVRQIAMEYKRAMGTGENAPKSNRVDLLGWDFAFEMNEVAKQQAALANIDFHFIRIPREVLDKKAVEQGDISFFELAALAVDTHVTGRDATLALTDFTIPLDDVPEDVQRAVTHWTQWIDYWAVDWDNKSDTFHNQWQTYRTRKDPKLLTATCHAYQEPGSYRVMVKVIDILGNDTTKTLTIEIP